MDHRFIEFWGISNIGYFSYICFWYKTKKIDMLGYPSYLKWPKWIWVSSQYACTSLLLSNKENYVIQLSAWGEKKKTYRGYIISAASIQHRPVPQDWSFLTIQLSWVFMKVFRTHKGAFWTVEIRFWVL